MDKLALNNCIRAWQAKILRIEKRALDDDAVRRIRADFEINRLEIAMTLRENTIESGGMLKLGKLKSELEAALKAANTRFKSENLAVITRPGNAFDAMLEESH